MSSRLWKIKRREGRPSAFETPADLWKAAVEYFEWVDENPIDEKKLFASQGGVIKADLPKMRAMTAASMCVFLDITHQTWLNYKLKPAFKDVAAKIEAIIWDQKFTGAAAGLLQHQIVARELGLADKTELSGKDGGPVEVVSLTTEERVRALAAILAKSRGES